ncbi:hypothetical protein ACIBH1_06370 [Nonomuraea sp. NPDC050663]|uniref:Uncharacterized protein n=1 Tax=Nonomuraea soli TaxID=1032476 RepID=A0A7W0HMV7_9ACTN|nr:hypothetical protein [Nonomuraea soli]MBA2889179.1 hypothetical protein [Nonomuraea soli]
MARIWKSAAALLVFAGTAVAATGSAVAEPYEPYDLVIVVDDCPEQP